MQLFLVFVFPSVFARLALRARLALLLSACACAQPSRRLCAGLIDGAGSDDEGGELEELALSQIDPLEAARRKGDPLASLDLAAYVADLFRTVAAARPEVMRAAAAELTPTQTAAVQRIWGA
jgi:hypothetical protein